ncbi:MAG: ion transporter [bacterium]|nr:ion transporter [bacterium]
MTDSNKPKDTPHLTLRETIQFYLIDSKSLHGKFIDISIIFLNLVWVWIFIINTYDLSPIVESTLNFAENIIVGFFIIEYIVRLYGARKRLRHLINPYTIIDLLAILPTLLAPFVDPGNIEIIKILRIFRVFRVLRFIRFFETAEFFFGKISEEMLKVLRLVMTIFMIFFVSSGLFYTMEVGENENVRNFGDAFYFTVVALTTVGFGDITPITNGGKAATVLCILSGIALIPWQVAEIIRNWIHIANKKHIVCPQCGLCYHDPDAVHCKACGHLIFQEYDSL